ncbi:hypothetical protein [Microvirga roseola]|uniref:hypothetical protein n=1 Tax=Microvirga roseola TaxID=2883126 RepID=UPI001E42E9C4|nr:hypothetical protein [Microvirga roseola]
MALSRSRLLYLVAMLVSGIAIGLFVADRPDLQDAVMPPAAWPFLVSLVLDVLIMQAASRGKAEPLTMGDRLTGVIGAGLIVIAILEMGS